MNTFLNLLPQNMQEIGEYEEWSNGNKIKCNSTVSLMLYGKS